MSISTTVSRTPSTLEERGNYLNNLGEAVDNVEAAQKTLSRAQKELESLKKAYNEWKATPPKQLPQSAAVHKRNKFEAEQSFARSSWEKRIADAALKVSTARNDLTRFNARLKQIYA